MNAYMYDTKIFQCKGMNSTIKTNVGKLLADALRYYHFDRFVRLIVESLEEDLVAVDMIAKNLYFYSLLAVIVWLRKLAVVNLLPSL